MLRLLSALLIFLSVATVSAHDFWFVPSSFTPGVGKPISLSLRLFGNIFGEDTLMATMVLLGAGISFSLTGGQAFVPGLPLQVPFYFLGLLSCTIQALVFTLLATVYIALWLPHEHHDAAHGAGHEAAHPAQGHAAH